MAVSRAGVGYKADKVPGLSASGSLTVDFNVASSAVDKVGVVVIGWVGDTDVSGSTFTPTWNGDAMTALCSALLTDSNKSMLRGWIIDDPDGGATSVVASYSSIPTGLLHKNLYVAAFVLANVEGDAASIIDSVVTATAASSVTSAGVTVASGVPADRVYSAHLVGKLRSVDGFTGTRVAAPHLSAGGQLVVGESRGDTTVTPTATFNASTDKWAAFGFNVDAMPLDGLGFSDTLTIPSGSSFGADLYRYAAPHPDRYVLVPPLGSADPLKVAGATIANANGVEMPVWTKDPDDTLDYTFSWNNHLAPDDEVIKVEHLTTGSLRLISEAINPDDKAMTQFWVKGATRGVTHPVRIRLWTKRGRQNDFTAYIAGEQN